MTPRHSFTARLMAFVKDRPLQWIPALEFEQFGRQAWRTRISEARQKFEAAHDGTIENRQRSHMAKDGTRFTHSEYRYVPEPVASEAPSDAADLNAWSLQ